MTVTVKPGADLSLLAPAGWKLVEAVKATAILLKLGIVITCGRDGHPPTDPHTLGEALDLRSHDFTADQKDAVLRQILLQLQQGDRDAPLATGGGWATTRFFGWLEHAGTSDEHVHVQRRRGTVYTAEDYFNG